MNLFNETLKTLEEMFPAIEAHRCTSSEISNALIAVKKEKELSLEQIWNLLNVDTEEQRDSYESILTASKEIKESIFHGDVFAIVPLYVTSFCEEHCVYCNYRADNADLKIVRKRLTINQLAQEIRFLIEERGFRVIELVYASDPKVRVSEICKHIQLTRQMLNAAGGGCVGLNSEPFDASDYSELRKAGLDFAVLWQETYQCEIYRHSHPGKTKKQDFDYRVNSLERMVASGLQHVGSGVLSGLAPWRFDWLCLIAHGRYLQKRFGIPPAIFGIPRLKSALGAQLHWTSFTPTEREYLLAIAIYNLIWPTAYPFVNTRESWDLCVKASAGGGALFTFDCKTIPGGYTQGSKGFQFPTFSFNPHVYSKRLLKFNLNPIFNWSFSTSPKKITYL